MSKYIGVLLALSAAQGAAAFDAEALGGADLACSACSVFLEQFHAKCASTVFKKGGNVAHKKSLAEKALETVVSDRKVQWAQTGNEGERKFVDFNKAMNGGSMNNMQVGGHVAEKLHVAFGALASEHGHTLASAMASSPRLYDAGLEKTFCSEDVGVCKRKGEADPDDRDEL